MKIFSYRISLVAKFGLVHGWKKFVLGLKNKNYDLKFQSHWSNSESFEKIITCGDKTAQYRSKWSAAFYERCISPSWLQMEECLHDKHHELLFLKFVFEDFKNLLFPPKKSYSIDIMCLPIVSTFSWGRKGVLISGNMLILEKCAYFGSRGFRILGIVYMI